MIPYDQIALLPYLIAETVAGRPYTGQEWSDQLSSSHIIEAKRAALTPEEVADFASWCDRRCRNAYENKASWFMRCENARDNSGRDQLYVYTTHWLVAYLNNPEKAKTP